MMLLKGFFHKEVEEAKMFQEAQRKAAPIALSNEVQCEQCGLDKTVRSPRMDYTGAGLLKTLIVGEAPGEKEDFYGSQFHEQGDAGIMLRKNLLFLGQDLDRDFYKTNAVNCRPLTNEGSNRTPTPKEVSCCRAMMIEAIEKLKPESVWLMGATAIDSYLMDRTDPIRRSGAEDKKQKRSSVDLWRGLRFPDIQRETWVYPMMHPAYILRNPAAEHVFLRDMKNALEHKKTRPVTWTWTKYTRALTNFQEIVNFLNRILSHEISLFSIDYETTGLKPFREGHEIVSVGIGYYLENSSYPRAMAFPLAHPQGINKEEQKEILSLLRKCLEDESIAKVAQNIQMEEKWSRKIIGCEVSNWVADTMQTAHILDERDRFTSLDKQVFLRYGYEYGGEISYYKKGFPFNRMKEAPLEPLLQYNALDALFTIMSYKENIDILHAEGLEATNEFWLESVLTMCDLEYAGININQKYYQETIMSIDDQIGTLTNEIFATEEVSQFRRVYKRLPDLGDKGGVTLDLAKLFFDVLKLTPLKTTDKGKAMMDDEFLESIDHIPIASRINKLRKLNKIKTTYLSGYLKEVVEVED